jgi:hypothetical protein
MTSVGNALKRMNILISISMILVSMIYIISMYQQWSIDMELQRMLNEPVAIPMRSTTTKVSTIHGCGPDDFTDTCVGCIDDCLSPTKAQKK